MFLCLNGHLTTEDAFMSIMDDKEECPICGQKFIWMTCVDQTNGCEDGEDHCPGYVDLKLAHQNECTCKECGVSHNHSPLQYFIPTNEGTIFYENMKHKLECVYFDNPDKCNCGAIFTVNENIKQNPWKK